jgi:hypothetical protein
MEKVIVALRRPDSDDEWIARLRGPIAAALLDLDLPGVTLNLRDGAVRDSLMTLTTLDPPVQGFVSLWTQQYYGTEIDEALRMLRAEADDVAAYLVTESAPMPPPDSPPGERASGMANMALLRRPAELDEQTWLRRWHHDHTPVAIATQSTFGYVQNFVVRPLTAGAPPLSAIVEEMFPIEAVSNLHAFFGASDDADLTDRLNKMVASTAAFGANVDVDTVPTGRYVFRNPFGS